MIHRLSQFGAYFFHPSTGINAVHNPAKETQPLGNIVAVDANVFFARPDIERQEILHAGRLGEKIGCMPELRCLHHHSAGIDITISVQGMYEPISVASVSFFRLFHKRVGNMLFWRDLSRSDIDSAIPWADAGRLYVNLSNVLRLASPKKIADFMMSFDPLAAKAIQGADGREYLSRTNRLKLLPFGALRKIPAVLLHVRRAKESPEQEHLRSQAKLRRFMDDAGRLAQKETSFVLLSEKLVDRLIQDVFLNTVPLFIIGRIA